MDKSPERESPLSGKGEELLVGSEWAVSWESDESPSDPGPEAKGSEPGDLVVPGVVASSVMLGLSDSTAVFVTGIRVYPTGLQLRLEVRTSGRGDELDDLHGWDSDAGPDRLFWTVEFADGRRTARRGDAAATSQSPFTPHLVHRSGSSDGRSSHIEYWLHPLPPPGPVTFTCEWTSRGIEVTRTVLDAGLLTAAVQGIRPVWPLGKG